MCSRALFAAVRSGDATRVTQSLQSITFHYGKRIDVDTCRDARHMPALVVAIECGFVKVVELLLAAKANINNEYEYQTIVNRGFVRRTPLMIAAHHGHPEIVELLLLRGVNVDATSSSDGTALLLAADAGHVQVVKALIKAGAAVNYVGTYRNSFSASALVLAASKGHADVVAILLEAGASVEIETEDRRRSALIFAADAGHVQVVKALIKAGAAVDYAGTYQDHDSLSALALATLKGHADVVAILLEAGASIEIETQKQRFSALIFAVIGGHAAIVEQLLHRKSPRGCSNWSLAMALVHALSGGFVETMDILLALEAEAPTMADEGRLKRVDRRVRALLASEGRGCFSMGTCEDARVYLALATAVENGFADVTKMLLDLGADIDKRLNNGSTPMLIAAQRGHFTIIELLISRGADIGTEKYHARETPLMAASAAGHARVVERLLEAAAAMDSVAQYVSHSVPFWGDGPALFLAAKNGHSDIVELLLVAGANAEITVSDGVSALSLAAMKGYGDVVKKLLDRGARANSSYGVDRNSPLVHASSRGHSDVVDLLLVAGADVSQASHRGRTALVAAAANGETAIVERLLAAGTDTTSDSALVAAAKRGHESIVIMLLAAGVRVQASPRRRGTALYHAAANGHASIVHRLLLAGAKVGYCRGNGDPALTVACKHGHIEVVKLLIDAGALLNDSGLPGDSLPLPVTRSVQRDQVEVLELLASHGVDITSAGRYGALCTASSSGSLACMRFLLAHGCESTDVNSALLEAARAGNLEIVQELLRHGADLTDASCNTNMNALYEAASSQEGTRVVEFLCSSAVVDRHVVDENPLTRDGYDTPLDWDAWRTYLAIDAGIRTGRSITYRVPTFYW